MAAVRSFAVKGGRGSARGVLADFQRDAWNVLVASGDSRLGGRDAHWRLPVKPCPLPTLLPAGPSATPSRKPSLSPGAGYCPPEQAFQRHSPLSTLNCGHYLPDALGISLSPALLVELINGCGQRHRSPQVPNIPRARIPDPRSPCPVDPDPHLALTPPTLGSRSKKL